MRVVRPRREAAMATYGTAHTTFFDVESPGVYRRHRNSNTDAGICSRDLYRESCHGPERARMRAAVTAEDEEREKRVEVFA